MMQQIPELAKFQTAKQIETRLDRDAQPGDMLLFYNATGVNRVIPLVTGSPFFHVAIYAGDMEVVEARPSGVVRRSLRDVDDIHDFVIVPAPQHAGQKALDWAATQLGAGYDRTDVLVMLLDRIFTNFRINYAPSDKWTCGEFVATAFDQADARLFPDLNLVDIEPGDFARFVTPADLPETSAQTRLKNLAFAGSTVVATVGLCFLARYVFRLMNPQQSFNACRRARCRDDLSARLFQNRPVSFRQAPPRDPSAHSHSKLIHG